MANREVYSYNDTETNLLNLLKSQMRGISTGGDEFTGRSYLHKLDNGDFLSFQANRYFNVSEGVWKYRDTRFQTIQADSIIADDIRDSTFMLAPLPVSETGVTALIPTFTASSLLGSLNELKVWQDLAVLGGYTVVVIDEAGPASIPAENMRMYLVDSLNGEISITLPNATDTNFNVIVVKTNELSEPDVIVKMITPGQLIGGESEQKIQGKSEGITVQANVTKYEVTQSNRGSAQAVLSESTGLIEGGNVTGLGLATFSIAMGQAQFIDTTSLVSPKRKINKWDAMNNITLDNLATADASWISVESDGGTGVTVIQTLYKPDPSLERTRVLLARLVHPNRTTISTIVNQPLTFINTMSQLNDLNWFLSFIKRDVTLYPNANLTVNKTSGYLYNPDSNWATNRNDLNRKLVPAETPLNFQYATQTEIDPEPKVTDFLTTTWDNAGVKTSFTGVNKATAQIAYLVASGEVIIQLGQKVYSSLADARSGYSSDPIVLNPRLVDSSIAISVILITAGCVDMTNTATCEVIGTDKFGSFGGGGGGVTTPGGNPDIAAVLAEGTDANNLPIINLQNVSSNNAPTLPQHLTRMDWVQALLAALPTGAPGAVQYTDGIGGLLGNTTLNAGVRTDGDDLSVSSLDGLLTNESTITPIFIRVRTASGDKYTELRSGQITLNNNQYPLISGNSDTGHFLIENYGTGGLRLESLGEVRIKGTTMPGSPGSDGQIPVYDGANRLIPTTINLGGIAGAADSAMVYIDTAKEYKATTDYYNGIFNDIANFVRIMKGSISGYDIATYQADHVYIDATHSSSGTVRLDNSGVTCNNEGAAVFENTFNGAQGTTIIKSAYSDIDLQTPNGDVLVNGSPIGGGGGQSTYITRARFTYNTAYPSGGIQTQMVLEHHPSDSYPAWGNDPYSPTGINAAQNKFEFDMDTTSFLSVCYSVGISAGTAGTLNIGYAVDGVYQDPIAHGHIIPATAQSVSGCFELNRELLLSYGLSGASDISLVCYSDDRAWNQINGKSYITFKRTTL